MFGEVGHGCYSSPSMQNLHLEGVSVPFQTFLESSLRLDVPKRTGYKGVKPVHCEFKGSWKITGNMNDVGINLKFKMR